MPGKWLANTTIFGHITYQENFEKHCLDWIIPDKDISLGKICLKKNVQVMLKHDNGRSYKGSSLW